MENKDKIFLFLLFILIGLFLFGICFLISYGVESNNEDCKKVCSAKGLQFYKWIGGHASCGCFDKVGDIIYYIK